ncbi:MAG: hypothetical protein ACOC92_01700 [bacterium]
MHRTPRRCVVALILAFGVFLVAATASAAWATPAERDVATIRTDGSFFDAVAAWLTGLLGDPRPAGVEFPAAFGLELLADPDPSAAEDSGAGPEAASDDPTADPELGPDADPHG